MAACCGHVRSFAWESALASFEARVFLVDDVYAAFAAHDAAIFIALLSGFEGAEDFHGKTCQKMKHPCSP